MGVYCIVLDVRNPRLSIEDSSQHLVTGFYIIRNKSVLKTKCHAYILFESIELNKLFGRTSHLTDLNKPTTGQDQPMFEKIEKEDMY